MPTAVRSSKLAVLAFLVLALFILSSPTAVDAKSASCRKATRHGLHAKHHKLHHQSKSDNDNSSQNGSPSSNPSPSTDTSSSSLTGTGDQTGLSKTSDEGSDQNDGQGASGHGRDANTANSTTLSSTNNGKNVTPGCKAGVAGGQSLKWTGSSLCWMTDWTPKPANNAFLNEVEAVSMLWGLGRVGHDDDVERFEAFKKLEPGSMKYVIGFNEADFQGTGSAGVIDPKEAAAAWDRYIAPHGEAGAVLISPSCAKQRDETWLKPFLSAVQHQPDVINVHIFVNSMEGVKGVLDHYAQYNKPMWITEFACINYQVSPTVYCSQQDTNHFVVEAVKLFESDDRVAAYAISDAYNGPFSALTPDHNGSTLSSTGRSFLAAVQSVSSKAKRDLAKLARRVN